MDERRFDAWTVGLVSALSSRRRIVQILTLGTAGLALPGLDILDVEAKKKKKKRKKKRCKRNNKPCARNKKCCSKRCCAIYGATGNFCAPKRARCCPGGGACAAETPVCCDFSTGPIACTTEVNPVCCFANDLIPFDYGCPAGTVCCNDVSQLGCCAPNGQVTTSDVAVEATHEATPLAPMIGAG